MLDEAAINDREQRQEARAWEQLRETNWRAYRDYSGNDVQEKRDLLAAYLRADRKASRCNAYARLGI